MRFMAEELKQNRAPGRVMGWARSQINSSLTSTQKKQGVVFA
jgi:hypothetical protein